MNKILYHPKPGTTGFFYGKFPEKPYQLNSVICDVALVQKYENEATEYYKAFEACKAEAIKNGEITNPELLSNYDVFISSLIVEQVFDLPKGLKVEKELIDPSWNDLKVKSVIRLVPIEGQSMQKEESGGIIIPKVMTDKNKILSRALTFLSDEDGIGKEIFNELATLMDAKEESQEELWQIEAERFYNENYSSTLTSEFIKPYVMNSYIAGKRSVTIQRKSK